MDKRTLRSKKTKSRSARAYDRQNQSIFGKVCSTVKGLLNPSWLLSQWTGNTEQEEHSDIEEETVREDNDIVSASVSHTNKRLRLRLEDRLPSIQSSGTQTWPEPSASQNLFQSPQSSLLSAKESLAVMNGDNHSENSEGSASTSGCSSLVSSNNNKRLVESPFQTMRSDIKSSRKRKEADASKSPFSDVNNSRSLWSSPSARFQRRLPIISNANQPNFNLSSFGGPSKLNCSMVNKVTSPFYEGKTAFGGASASRKMPTNTAPYQVDKTLRNQIKVREQPYEDSLEGMSSAAKRILLTLEKMSTPVADAKKIPNSNTSPVDLSLYLNPPKSRRNCQFTPSLAKGPPIANINTIAKLATLKNYGVSRLRNTVSSTPVISAEQPSLNFSLPLSTCTANLPKGGGGKMRNKLNQHHESAKDSEYEMPEFSLPNVPLPISTLPTINFGQKTEQKKNQSFTFSHPIEHDLAVTNAVPASHAMPEMPSLHNVPLPTINFGQKADFTFSNPIEYDLATTNAVPASQALPVKSSTISAQNSVSSFVNPSTMWKCTSCWVQNPPTKTACLSCETPKKGKSVSMSNSPAVSISSTWECSSCWVRNPVKEAKCLACESSCPSTQSDSGFKSGDGFKFNSPVSSSPVTFKFGSFVATTESTSTTTSFNFGTASPKSGTTTTTSNLQFGSRSKVPETSTPSTDFKLSSPFSATNSSSATTRTSQISNATSNNIAGFQIPVIEVTSNTSSDSKDSTSTNVAETSKQVPTSNSPALSTSTTWECSSCWVRNPVKETKCLACEAARPTTQSSSVSGTTMPIASTSTTWECNICWVRNPVKETKCLACETARPTTQSNSAFKIGDGFKFGSPVHSSPITFKFGNSLSTTQSTSTPTSFNFGSASTQSSATTTTSGFQFSSLSNTQETSTAATGFKFGTTSLTTSTSSGLKFGSPLSTSSVVSSSASVTSVKTSQIPNVTSSSNPGFQIPTIEVTSNSSNDSKDTPSTSVSEPSKQVPASNLTTLSTSTTWECSSCWVRNPLKETKCLSCETARSTTQSNSDSTLKSAEKSSNAPTLPTSAVSGGFVFGAPKTEAQSTKSAPFVFGSTPVSSSSINFKFGSPVSTTQPTSTTASFNFGTASTQSGTTTMASGFPFGSASNASETSASATIFKFGTTPITTSASSGLKLGTPQNTTSSVVSSEASSAITKTSLIPAATSSSNVGFQMPSVEVVSNSSKDSKDLPTTTIAEPSKQVSSNSTPSTTWECGSCWVQNPMKETKCVSCEVARSTTQSIPGFMIKNSEKPPNTSTSSSTAAGGGFVFGAPKTEAQGTNAAAPFVFGSTFKSGGDGFKFASTNNSSPVTFKFGNAASTTQATSTTATFNFGTSSTQSAATTTTTSGFQFGSLNNAPETSAATTGFKFGTATTNPSTFQPSQPANPTFQFGSTPAPAFGTSGNFAFGNPASALQNSAPAFGTSTPSSFAVGPKTDTLSQNPSTVSQAPALLFGSSTNTFSFGNKTDSAASQNPAPAFGSTVFGSGNVPPFGAPDSKPASGGFTFGAPTPGVFQFDAGSSEKKPAAPNSGFTFGTPTAAPEANSSFSTGFTMNTPPSFNFGATSTPAGPFQFAASAPEAVVNPSSAPRKYRKAVRRVRKD